MSVSRGFVEHVLDLMGEVRGVSARRMFGGYGLYVDGTIFGLLDDEELFLKTDEKTLPFFVEANCSQWVYQGRKSPLPTAYYRPPDEAFEHAEAMTPWAKLACEAAGRAAVAKAAKERTTKRAPLRRAAKPARGKAKR